MKTTDLIELIRRLLRSDANLDFLSKLSEIELETLVACIRERVDQIRE